MLQRKLRHTDDTKDAALEEENEAEHVGNFTLQEEECELEQQIDHVEGSECCIMYGQEDDEESEIWIECTMCLE